MMLTHVLLCSLLVGPVTQPSPLLANLYEQQYGCRPTPATAEPGVLAELAKDDLSPVASEQVGSFFPAAPRWWPLFTNAQIGNAGYLKMQEQGIVPGVLLPENPLALLAPKNYLKYRQAAKDGAVMVQVLHTAHMSEFAAHASFATALGLRPLAALVVDGWSDYIPSAGNGAFLVDHRASAGYQGLPVPARINQLDGRFFYYANDVLPVGGGLSVLIDPPEAMSHAVANVDYPQLGLTWRYAGADFQSDQDGLHTSIAGYVLAMLTLFAVPVGVFYAAPWPDVLQLLGTSISWFWLFVGACLLALLILAALRRLRRDA